MLIELSNWIDYEKSLAELKLGEGLSGIFPEINRQMIVLRMKKI